MAQSVSALFRPGESYDQFLARTRAEIKAYRDAYAAHPFAGAYDGLTDDGRRASEAPRWRGTEKVFANGVHRIVIRKDYPDPQATLDRFIQRDLRMPTGMEVDPDPEANRKRAARRAKTTVIDKAIAAGMNSLHTLTFKANVTDLDDALRCFDAYRRACQRILKGWRYVVCWQRQERGAWHFHLATYRLPRFLTDKGVKINSWDVMRKLWRQAAGAYGGNFDEVKDKRRNGARVPFKRSGQIARYIGRYIGRDIGGDEVEALKGRKSFATSKGIKTPQPVRYVWDGEGRWNDLLKWAMDRVGPQSSYWFSAELQVFFIESLGTTLLPLPRHRGGANEHP